MTGRKVLSAVRALRAASSGVARLLLDVRRKAGACVKMAGEMKNFFPLVAICQCAWSTGPARKGITSSLSNAGLTRVSDREGRPT